MSTLTVLMPPRDATVSPQAWQLPELRYLLADRRGRTVRVGVAPLALLPKASVTILMLAARDVLLVDAVVPPLAGARLRQALPNLVEEQLLPDGPPSHIALGPGASAKTALRRTVAAIDRGWFRFLHEAFTTAGHRMIRAVPLVACLPMVTDSAPLAAVEAAARATEPLAATMPLALSGQDTVRDRADAVSDAAPVADDQALAEAAEAAERAEAHALAASATVLIVDGIDAGAAATRSMFAPAALDAVVAQDPVADLPGAAPFLAMHGGADDADAGAGDSLQLELAIRRLPVPPLASKVPLAERLAGEGLVVPIDALVSTLNALLPGIDTSAGTSAGTSASGSADGLRGREIFRLVGADAWDSRLERALRRLDVSARPITFETLAQRARDAEFDLCQFEFAARPWRLPPGSWRQMRLPVALLVASVLVAVAGINIQWAQLARQRDAVQAQMTALLLEAFPRTTVVLDPAVQMRRSLAALRVAAGELSPDDFLPLTNGLALAMGAIPPAAIASLDYDRQALQLTFRDDARPDPGLRERLARQGLDGSADGKRWTIRSMR